MEQPLTQRTGASLEPTTLQPRAPRPQTVWGVPQGSTVQAMLTLPTPLTVVLGGTVRAGQTAQTPPPTEGSAPPDIIVLKVRRLSDMKMFCYKISTTYLCRFCKKCFLEFYIQGYYV